MTTAAAAQDRIQTAALAAGWATRTGGVPSGACTVEYRRGSKRVWIYYGVYGQIIEASYQQGSVGGRCISGKGKADRVIEVLEATRWSR